MKKQILFYSMILLKLISLSSCSLEKEIDLDLPEYEKKLVVECYLEPGLPYRMLLSESVSYFESPDIPHIDSALVIITRNGISDTLKNKLALGPGTGKIYNYTSNTIVPEDYISEFSLEIIDRKGRRLTGKTKIPAPVLIDTVEFRYDNDSIAFPLTKFKDNPLTVDYYRYQITRDSYLGEELEDLNLTDVINNSNEIIIGTQPRLKKGDLVFITLYHINKDYYEFLESVGSAIDANGNPFEQPAAVRSNVEGGMGVFTGYSFDRKAITTP